MPVLIVGAGPVGLVLSILLAKLGVKSLVVERRLKHLHHPQAHFINNRTMEIFRRLGALSEEIEESQPPPDQWRNFVYCTSLTGPLLGIVDHLRPQDLTRKDSPTWVAHFSQHRLVPLLLQRAERFGVHVGQDIDCDPRLIVDEEIGSMGHIKFGHECISVEETLEGAKAGLQATGSGAQYSSTVKCDFLIGADGSASSVRRLMGVKMEGEHALQNLISIHFFSNQLAQYLSQNRPGMLYFVFNPRAIGVLIAHDLRLGEFVVQVPFYPPQQSSEDFTIEACKHVIFSLAGLDLTDLEIKTVRQWAMHAQVAERYVSDHRHIILAGDAAHRFPPAGGFGMNTGIQDAHNLAWKLAAILNDVAPHAILSTYEAERHPIAKANTALSLSNFKAAMSIPSALGLDPSNARLIHQAINSRVGSLLPTGLQRTVLERIFALGRSQLSPFILNTYNPLGSTRLQRVKHILEEGQSLQLQFPAEDLGFRYKSGALFMGEEVSQDVDKNVHLSTRKEYHPVCKVGARLPHLSITILDKSLQKTEKGLCSTLDLIGGDSLEFLFFVGPNDSGRLWADSMLLVAKHFHVMLKVIVVWPIGYSSKVYEQMMKTSLTLPSDSVASEDMSTMHVWGHEKGELVMHVEEVDRCWWDLCKVPCVGAILVRPDDHVAWLSLIESSSDSIKELDNVFATVLKRPCQNIGNLT